MNSRRAFQQDYARGGEVYGSAARAIAPTAFPSLSTGQGFYTVESLEGVTVVPPPQPAPPPPRLLPSEPYHEEFRHPRMARRLHVAERGDFDGSNLFERHYPPPPAKLGRKMMIPSHDMSLSRHREDPCMVHRRPAPAPFMGEPRMPEFFYGPPEPPPPSGAWGPRGDYGPRWSDQGRDQSRSFQDQSRSFQRSYARTQSQRTAKPLSQAKTTTKHADASPSVRKQSLGDGKRHKKPAESQIVVDKTAESKDDAVDEAIAEKGAKSEVKLVKIVPEDKDKSNQKERVKIPQTVTAVAGKKRGVKVVTQTNKKPRKSVGPSVSQSDTPIKSKDERENVEATCTEGMRDVGIEGADDAARIPKYEGKKSEQPLSRETSAVEPAKGQSQSV